MAYPMIGDPVGIANIEQLAFVINIGTKVKSTQKVISKIAKPGASLSSRRPSVLSMFEKSTK